MIRLGINVDHVATLRNVRDEHYPDPVAAAQLAIIGGADNITIHLREDRRHIRDADLFRMKEGISVPLNFEMGHTSEMVDIALKVKAHAVTLVPERRAERTTERGLHPAEFKKLRSSIVRLKKSKMLVSLFIDTDSKSIDQSAEVGADAVEFHTGPFCQDFAKAISTSEKVALIKPLTAAAERAHKLGMQVHFGHGLNYGNANWLQLVPHCEEANIGHAVMARAIFVGMTAAVSEMKQLLNNSSFRP
jgi:pyridoxine 5-phosphate synthase